MSETILVVNHRARRILFITILVLLGALAILVAVLHSLLQPPYLPDSTARPVTHVTWVRSLYGYGPDKEQQLYRPSSVAVGPDGVIYATDPSRSRVVAFRPDGSFDRIIGPQKETGGIPFIRPEGIDVDEEGTLYVADSLARKVFAVNANGKLARTYGVDYQARGVRVADGKVYILDVGKVLIFEVSGKRLGEFGNRGTDAGEIDAYQGIEASDGRIFVVDSFNKRLQRFSEAGTLEWAVPVSKNDKDRATRASEVASTAPGPKVMQLPQDAVFDGAGRLLVVDAFTFQVVAIDPDTGGLLGSYGEYGSVDGMFFYPTSIDYDPVRDWVVVADTNNDRIQIVRLPGTAGPEEIAIWRVFSSPLRYLFIPGLLLILAGILVSVPFITAARTVRSMRDEEASTSEEFS